MYTDTCCFTGHRVIPQDQREDIEKRLGATVEALIHKGVRTFAAGGALGFDTMAAQAVLRLKRRYPGIRLVLVLPCRDQTKAWQAADIDLYESIKSQADEVLYTGDRYYSGCMAQRNRRLVDMSGWCVFYLTKPSGGTRYTVNYARQKGLHLLPIRE